MMENFESKYPSVNVNLLYKYDTVFCSDSFEWCPHEPFQNYFVLANYQLAEDESQGKCDKPRSRSGRILLFSIQPETGLKLHQTINTEAVLDQKWCHNTIDGLPILGIVNAKKTLEIYALNLTSCELNFVSSYTVEDNESETLLLSLDWSTGKFSKEEPEIICSDSKGNIHRFLYRAAKLELLMSWHAHEYEAWIAAFYYWDDNIVFTGGDDSLLLQFDKRVGKDPVRKNRKHEAGVTCIHSNVDKEHVFATGSYDSYLRIWDIRNLKLPTKDLQLPGTMWRLKWDPWQQDNLLAACMLGGVHIIQANNLEEPKVVESFYEHKNIAYGSDWCYLKQIGDYDTQRNVIIGSCSFYDHLLCVYSINLEK